MPPHPRSLRACGALRRLVLEPASEFAARARAAWARLICKVYEVCPKCKGPMRVIALIDDPGVIRRILEHLGRWAPEAPCACDPSAKDAPSLYR